MELKDKIVLVTGSSSGIGKQTAIRFAKQGAKVVINYRENVIGAEETLKEIQKTNGIAEIIKADVSKPEDIKKLFAEIIKKFGTIDILINNAGIPSDISEFMKSTKEEINILFDTNLVGAMLCCQEALKIMQEKGSGKILNTTSVRGWEHGGRAPVYGATKAALNSFTKTLAKMVAPKIQVNAVAPGFVKTRNYNKIPEEMHKLFLEQTYLKRWITEDEIADAFVFLAKNDAMTGQVIYVDGGFTLK